MPKPPTRKPDSAPRRRQIHSAASEKRKLTPLENAPPIPVPLFASSASRPDVWRQPQQPIPPLDGSGSLLSKLANRLSQVEEDRRKLLGDIQLRDQQISSLEEELEFQRSAGESKSNREAMLEQRCLDLRHRLKQVNDFVADHGIIFKPTSRFDFDFERFRREICALNKTAGEGIAKIVRNSDGSHNLRIPPTYPLWVYSNGIFFMNGPFRPFTDNSENLNGLTSQEFITDVLDGYFPLELQQDFPNGLVFDLHDCRNEVYRQQEVFSGKGNHLISADIDEDESDNSESREEKLTEDLEMPYDDQNRGKESTPKLKQVSKDGFLKLLPSTTVRENGDVYHIRQDIEAALLPDGPEIIEILFDDKCDSRALLRISTPHSEIRANIAGHCTIKQLFQMIQGRTQYGNFRLKVPGETMNFEPELTLIESGLLGRHRLHLVPLP